LEVYNEHFEDPFIKATQRYYKAESNSFLAINSISEYLKQAENRLREEEDRGDLYLNAKTRKVVSNSLARDATLP
jgi:cullin 1